MLKYLSFVGLLFVSYFLLAQELVLPPDNIKTIEFEDAGGNKSLPVIPLHGSVNLSFDDLDADEKDYYYQIEHCDKYFETSDIFPTDFVKGYDRQQIYDYQNSFNTLQNYTHYNLRIPNKDTRLLISGNYRLSILDDEDNVVFTRYFVVYESSTTVGVSVHRTRDVSYIDTQQSVQFVINHKGFNISNPHEFVYPIILQNNDLSTKVEGVKPQFMRQNQLMYKYDDETAFWGGNEFLNFDTKELTSPNNTVAQVKSGDTLYSSLLYIDKPRALMSYTYYPDVNGTFVIRNIKADNSDTESDYSWVYFTLHSEELLGKKVYVYGMFNDYQLTNNQMTYNADTDQYEAQILLKQGFYNYNYVVADDQNMIDSQQINGSFDETENVYEVIIYYTEFGSQYDRVIGYGIGSSKKLDQ